MQPYLFPYLGYFQLIYAVDAFVVYDDVNFMKGGWLNRNYILAHRAPQLITLPLQGSSPNKFINQVKVGSNRKILKSIRQCYSKAPHFNAAYPVLEDILKQTESNLAFFLFYQLRRICAYLGLDRRWVLSSELSKDSGLRGQDKVLSICKELNATHYVNAAGGKALYDESSFHAQNIQLSFIEPRAVEYKQFGDGFVPNLSIIDVLMFNDREECARLINEHDLV